MAILEIYILGIYKNASTKPLVKKYKAVVQVFIFFSGKETFYFTGLPLTVLALQKQA